MHKLNLDNGLCIDMGWMHLMRSPWWYCVSCLFICSVLKAVEMYHCTVARSVMLH